MGTEKAPYPADTKNKGWRFELDLEQIAQSDTWALAKPDVRPWLLMLWSISWQQIPCGSLPDDDEIIAARIGMDLNLFTEKRAMLMRGWYKADDGRLYHPTIAQRVLAMLETKQKEKDRKAAYRANQAKLSSNVPRDNQVTDSGKDVRQDGDGRGIDPGCDATGTRTGTGTSLKTLKPSSSNPDGFDAFWSAYPKKVGKVDAIKSWKKIKPSKQTSDAMLAALAWQCESEQWTREGGQFVPHPSTYLNQGRWLDEKPDPSRSSDSSKPKWYETASGIDEMGAKLGLKIERGENWAYFKERVFASFRARKEAA